MEHGFDVKTRREAAPRGSPPTASAPSPSVSTHAPTLLSEVGIVVRRPFTIFEDAVAREGASTDG